MGFDFLNLPHGESGMDEHKIFAIELGGLFPELTDSPKVHGTAGEILERIADEWGLEEEDAADLDIPLDGVYPSIRAFRAHQLLEDRLASKERTPDPDKLIEAMINEGLARKMTEDEYEELMDLEDLDEYEEARGELDEEWVDGLWEN
jgi:hypothetical protein